MKENKIIAKAVTPESYIGEEKNYLEDPNIKWAEAAKVSSAKSTHKNNPIPDPEYFSKGQEYAMALETHCKMLRDENTRLREIVGEVRKSMVELQADNEGLFTDLRKLIDELRA